MKSLDRRDSDNTHGTKSDQAEYLRLKYKYRRLILEGKLILPPGDAARLIGPDCAYHLYSLPAKKPSKGSRSRSNRGAKS